MKILVASDYVDVPIACQICGDVEHVRMPTDWTWLVTAAVLLFGDRIRVWVPCSRAGVQTGEPHRYQAMPPTRPR